MHLRQEHRTDDDIEASLADRGKDPDRASSGGDETGDQDAGVKDRSRHVERDRRVPSRAS